MTFGKNQLIRSDGKPLASLRSYCFYVWNCSHPFPDDPRNFLFKMDIYLPSLQGKKKWSLLDWSQKCNLCYLTASCFTSLLVELRQVFWFTSLIGFTYLLWFTSVKFQNQLMRWWVLSYLYKWSCTSACLQIKIFTFDPYLRKKRNLIQQFPHFSG